MKYFTKVTGWGKDAFSFLENPETNFLILFNESAPSELAEIAVLHTEVEMQLEPSVGDVMLIGEKAFTITAIGDEALLTLKSLGHCTLTFTGKETPDRPGCIMLRPEGEPLTQADITVGTSIEID